MTYLDRNRAAWHAIAAAALPGDTAQSRPRFEWTQFPGLGPGVEILGDLRRRRVLELGCGNGDNTSALHATGAYCTGLDAAPAQIARAQRRWPDPGFHWVCSDAISFLRQTSIMFDCIVSVFGAVDLAPPHLLLPLVARRLEPGGTLAFATAAPNWLGPKASHLTSPDGVRRAIVRWTMPPSMWIAHLAVAGLRLDAITIAKDDDGAPCTYILVAKRDALNTPSATRCGNSISPATSTRMAAP
jgi:SAM-dependent methyltransferase